MKFEQFADCEFVLEFEFSGYIGVELANYTAAIIEEGVLPITRKYGVRQISCQIMPKDAYDFWQSTGGL